MALVIANSSSVFDRIRMVQRADDYFMYRGLFRPPLENVPVSQHAD